MYAVKCYGGPYHGKVVAAKEDRFQVAVLPPLPPLPPLMPWEPDEPIGDFRAQIISYSVHRYAESNHNPYRTRESRVAVLEGAEMFQDEKYEFEADLRERPWRLNKGNILDDFEQWFSASVYKHFHEIWWLGRRKEW